jgi:hypothetical protein
MEESKMPIALTSHDAVWSIITLGLVAHQHATDRNERALMNTQILHDLYGPPNDPKLSLTTPSGELPKRGHCEIARADLNEDGRQELLVLISPFHTLGAARLIDGNGVAALGMAMFTERPDGVLWPLFYTYDGFDGFFFRRHTEADRSGILHRWSQPGRHPIERFWYCPSTPGRSSTWQAGSRLQGKAEWSGASEFWSVYRG